MTQILVITHGALATDFIRVAERVLNTHSSAIPICFDIDADQTDYQQLLQEVLEGIRPDQNILILTDLFGGTPSNLSIPYIQKNKVEVITGINLAMLIYLLSQPKGKEFSELCTGVKKAGQEAIVIAGEFLA